MQQGRGQIAAHAFAQAQLADRRVQIFLQVEQFTENIEAPAKVRVGDFVNLFEQLEGFDDGNVPPKLRALAKHHADVFGVMAAFAIRNESIGDYAPARGRQNSGQDFDGGGLPRPVGADITHHLAAVRWKS